MIHQRYIVTFPVLKITLCLTRRQGSSSGENVCLESSTELDSHANMVVIGKQAFIFSHSGQYANVRAFTDEVKVIPKVPIVDAVIAYDCPQSGQTYIIVVRNALCVPSMEHNLISPFILREAGFY